MKKRLAIVLGGLSLLLILVGYVVYAQSIQSGQDTVVSIYQKDENGTPIVSPSPIKLVKKAGHRNPFVADLAEYTLTSRNPLGRLLPRENQTVHLRYRSALTVSELQDRLANANYWQVGTQNVATPVFNGTQVQTNSQEVGRISTSRDGVSWTKLPISYPNVKMSHPTVVYQNKHLLLFDRQHYYETTDFHHWQEHALKLTSSQFKNGQLLTVINTEKQPLMVVRATDRATQKSRLYYGKWQVSQRQISDIKRIKTGATPLKADVTLVKADSKFYLLQAQGHKVQVLRASQLDGQFKAVKSLRLPVHHERTAVSTVSLIALKPGRLRVIYNLVDHQKMQLGTYYQDFDSDLKPIHQSKQLTTDFLWTNFELAENKR